MGRRLVAGVFAVLLLGMMPASAGTPGNPEVSDPCGNPVANAGLEPAASWEDICAVWFDTATPAGGVTVTIQTGALQPRTPSVRTAAWSVGGCRMAAVAEDASGPDQLVDHALYVQCSEPHETPCPVPNDIQSCYTTDDPVRVALDGAVTETANTVTFAITPNRLPANLRGLLDAGSTLTDPMALAGPLVAGQTLNAGAPCEELTCASKVGDATPHGRSFQIGG